MEIKYKKDDVWLARYEYDFQPLRIKNIRGKFVEHDYGWEEAEVWHQRARVKIGTVRRFLGIPIGVKLDP